MSTFGITVARHGEELDFGELGAVKASIKPSTKATYSLANRAYYVEGQCFKTEPTMFAEGDYFTRTSDGKKYLISTIQAEPLAPDLVYLYGIQCNTIVSLYREKVEIDKDKNRKRIWKPIAENIYCYRDFVDRSGKTTNDGVISQEIFTLIISHKHHVSDGDRIVMKFNQNGEYKDINFKVESVGTALVALDGNSGVNTVQMSLDIRNA